MAFGGSLVFIASPSLVCGFAGTARYWVAGSSRNHVAWQQFSIDVNGELHRFVSSQKRSANTKPIRRSSSACRRFRMSADCHEALV
jgi:hypothetical protein